MVCKKCNQIVPVNATFCLNCGAPLAAPGAQKVIIPNRPQTTAERNTAINVSATSKSKSSGSLIGFLLIAAVVWYLAFGNPFESHSIIGTWEFTEIGGSSPSAYDLSGCQLLFGKDGTGSVITDTYVSGTFSYIYEDDIISISMGLDSISLPCEINGNHMSWTDPSSGETMEFIRK